MSQHPLSVNILSTEINEDAEELTVGWDVRVERPEMSDTSIMYYAEVFLLVGSDRIQLDTKEAGIIANAGGVHEFETDFDLSGFDERQTLTIMANVDPDEPSWSPDTDSYEVFWDPLPAPFDPDLVVESGWDINPPLNADISANQSVEVYYEVQNNNEEGRDAKVDLNYELNGEVIHTQRVGVEADGNTAGWVHAFYPRNHGVESTGEIEICAFYDNVTEIDRS